MLQTARDVHTHLIGDLTSICLLAENVLACTMFAADDPSPFLAVTFTTYTIYGNSDVSIKLVSGRPTKVLFLVTDTSVFSS